MDCLDVSDSQFLFVMGEFNSNVLCAKSARNCSNETQVI